MGVVLVPKPAGRVSASLRRAGLRLARLKPVFSSANRGRPEHLSFPFTSPRCRQLHTPVCRGAVNCLSPLPHSIQRLLHNACCGLPPRCDGSLDERRRARQLVVFIASLDQQPLRRRTAHTSGCGESSDEPQSRHRHLRALRPASTDCLSSTNPDSRTDNPGPRVGIAGTGLSYGGGHFP